MNPANVLAMLLRSQYPTASVQSDISESGEIGFVDIVSIGGVHLAIECDEVGFGLSKLPTEGYGGPPDETFDDLAPLLDRIRALISVV